MASGSRAGAPDGAGRKTGVAALMSKFDTRHPKSPPLATKSSSAANPPSFTSKGPSPDKSLLSSLPDEKKQNSRSERKKSKRSESGDVDSVYIEELEEDLFDLEDRCEVLESENRICRQQLSESQNEREDIQKRYENVRTRLVSLEEKQIFLEEENKTLNDRIRFPPGEQYSESDLRMQLQQSELKAELLDEENEALRAEIENLQLEMEEIHDQFREENDVMAFRELQKELETTAKNCRILQFKLRKAERKSQKLEQEKMDYEERTRKLESHIQCEDDKVHIKELEDELRMAKEVSVRLHDELEVTEERKAKYEEECTRLKDRIKASEAERQELNTQMERLKNEMERLRADLIDQNADPGCPAPSSTTPSINITSAGVDPATRLSPHRAPSLGSTSRQSSTEHDVAQLMRDLSDSKERQLDMKEQLKFAEEEIRITRKKLSELEEENESLVLQLRKMSQKRELRRGSAITSADETDDMTESEAEYDSKLHLELAEQEMNVLRRKMAELEKQNETMGSELTQLQMRLTEKEKEVCELLQTDPEDGMARKSTLLTAEIETLKWRLIEKDREIERLAKLSQTPRHGAKLKKSRSLDSDNTVDLRKQLELVTQEAAILNERLRDIDNENERLVSDNNKLLLIAKKRVPDMSLDDPKVDNVLLKDKIEELQLEVKRLKASLVKAEEMLREAGLQKCELSAKETPDEIKTKEKLQSAEEEIVKLRRRLSDLTKQHNELLNRMKRRRDKAKKLDDLSVEELKDEIEDLDDEISELKQRIKLKEDSSRKIENDLEDTKREQQALELKFKIRERDLLEELNGLEQKNDILSNLLEALQNRDSQSTFGDSTTSTMSDASSASRTSDRSCISVISDVSVGSDDVFQDGKQLTDNEKQFRMRLEYLEKLLSQERMKVKQQEGLKEQTTTLNHEKSSLKTELEACKKQLESATQQVADLKARLKQAKISRVDGQSEKLIEEHEHEQRRAEVQAALASNAAIRQENDELNKRLVVYMKHVAELTQKLKGLQDRHSTSSQGDAADVVFEFEKDLETMQERCTAYSIKTEELQMELRQLTAKYDHVIKDRTQLQTEWRTAISDLESKDEQLISKTELLTSKEVELKQKEKALLSKDGSIAEKDKMLKQKEDIIKTYESASKQRETELKKLRDQVAQKEVSIRQQDEKIIRYGDSLRQRDDQLSEKDDTIQQLSNKLQLNKQQLTAKEREVATLNEKLSEKETTLSKLSKHLNGDDVGIAGLQDRVASMQEEREKLQSEVKSLKTSRTSLEKSKRDLEAENQLLKDKIRVAEISRTTYTESKVVKTLLEEKSKLVDEKKRLERDLESLRSKRNPDSDKLEKMVNEKSVMLTDAADTNERLESEIKLVSARLKSTTAALAEAHAREDHLSTTLKKFEGEIKRQKEAMDKRIQRDENMTEIETQALKASFEDRLNHYQNEIQRLRNQILDLQMDEEARNCMMEELEMHLESSRKKYNKDFSAWEQERSNLVKKISEVSEKKREVSRLNRSVDELKCELLEAEVTRSDLVHRFALEKQEWSTEKIELQNRISQLEELTKEPKERHGKFKDLKAKLEKHARMEVVFDKERSDHKKLLTEAQQMAGKLQDQLKESEAKHMSEKKEILRKHAEKQIESEAEREELETRIAQYEANAQRFAYMLTRMEEMERRTRKHEDNWQTERKRLMSFLQRLQTCLSTEREKFSRMVSELKVVGDIKPLVDLPDEASKESKPSEDTDEKKFQKRLKLVLAQLVSASEDITKYYHSTKEEVYNLCQWKSFPVADSSDSLYYQHNGRAPSLDSHTSFTSDVTYGLGPAKTHLSRAYHQNHLRGQEAASAGNLEYYGRRGLSSSPARRSHLPTPPPSFILRPSSNTSLPLMRSTDSLDGRFDPNALSDSTQSLTVKLTQPAPRGRPLKKAASVDTQQGLWSASRASSKTSTDMKYEKVKAYIEENGSSFRHMSEERLAIDQARRRFFEGGYESADSGFNSLPDRKKGIRTQSTPMIAKVPEGSEFAEVTESKRQREHTRESKLASLSRDIKRSFQSITSLSSKKSLSPKSSVKNKDKDSKKSPVAEKKKVADDAKKESQSKPGKAEKTVEKKPEAAASKAVETQATDGAEAAKPKQDAKKPAGVTKAFKAPSIFSNVAQRRQMFQQKAKSVESDN